MPNPVDDVSKIQAEVPLQPLQNLLNQPAMQKYVRLVSNPDFTQDLSVLLQNPKMHQILYWELGWILFIVTLRSWRNSKSKKWISHVWIFLWTTCLFWVGLIWVMPHFVLGPSFDHLIKDSSRILSESK